jgi:sialate O-acetylesterase
LLLFLFFLPTMQAQGAENSQLRCANIFSDHMVLQREQEVPVWGWSAPEQEVIVRFAGQEKRTLADPAGKWKVRFDPMAASSRGREMVIIAGDSIQIADILVGDVWLCSGQSNMEMNLRPGPDAVFNVEEEIATADYPDIRLLKIPPLISFHPKENIKASAWDVCSPQSVPSFSAAGYFFGRELYKKIGIPIGLINASMGASTAEAWTGAEALGQLNDFKRLIRDWPEKARQAKEAMARYEHESAEWNARLDGYDAGYYDGKPVWADTGLDDSQWRPINLPTHWEKAGFPDIDGFMWFRKTVELTETWSGKDLSLGLGTINDMDRVWFNGVEVGRFEKTSGWTAPRVYPVPAKLIRKGQNVITVRVYDIGNNGGICGSAQDMWLHLNENRETTAVSLSDAWVCKLGLDLRSIAPRPVLPDFSESNKRMPTGLYNGIIAPLAPFAIKGVIWYQGESNAGRAGQYHSLLPAMIKNWRHLFGQGDLPFGIVQLPNFLPRQEQPSESSWAELREAQTMTAARVPRCGLIITIDIGEADYIHPRNKQDVGKRLALWALANVYGRQVEFSGPVFKAMKIEENQAILTFTHAENGLISREDSELSGFAVAGSDSVFHWAKAIIKNNQVVVWSENVSRPLAVRYAWADNPACNLCNKSGLPAVPFRTDRWKRE